MKRRSAGFSDNNIILFAEAEVATSIFSTHSTMFSTFSTEFSTQNTMNKIFLPVITGPTASGKTALAVELALQIGGEVVSADSMQVYRDMAIATAQPTEDDKRGVPHHLIGFLDPREPFSVANYTKLAEQTIAEINGRGVVPILCGGTGLYIDSLLSGMSFAEEYAFDEKFRAELRREAAEFGNHHVWKKLLAVDEEYALALHENNLNRVIRALELVHHSKMTATEVRKKSLTNTQKYEFVKFAVNFAPREILYERVNERVRLMFQSGLLQEAEQFFEKYENAPTAAQAIGYKELKPYFLGNSSLETCSLNLMQATRNYAKKQLTWFRRDKCTVWLESEKTIEMCGKVTQIVVSKIG
ncbi:MAG: tRNA (adenosine(37)-N6)-dimethylallyltransferase MiaA [Oscillospiraceae bacterium]|nr:tRNA (adenosine(37)-N6)-dimethylallyltransferase MiaA [Oscillospiraceae bacterium]